MPEYTVTESETIEVEELLATLKTFSQMKDLLNIDFIEDSHNVLLNRKMLELIYLKVLEFERRLKSLEKKK